MGQFKPLPMAYIQDKRQLAVFEAIEANLRALFALMGGFIETDHSRGEVRVSGPVRPREVMRDPNQQSTFGRKFEVVSVKEPGATDPKLFQKRGLTQADDDWQEVNISPPGTIQPDFFFQDTVPTSPEFPAIWWKVVPGGMELWINMQWSDATWHWSYRGTTVGNPVPP